LPAARRGEINRRLVTRFFEVGAVALVSGALLAGCFNSNVYEPPRTTPPGEVSMLIALEGTSWRTKQRSDGYPVYGMPPEPPRLYIRNEAYPELPLVGLRLGIAERVDAGLRLVNLVYPAADLKWNFLRTTRFDLAVDPGAAWGWPIYAQAQLPLLVGLNLAEWLSVVASPGVMYGSGAYGYGGDLITAPYYDRTDWYGRLGGGLDVRFTPRFAVQPTVTYLRALRRQRGAAGLFTQEDIVNVGIGFKFGALPDYRERP
jgi:hypothetical protein